MIGEIGVLVLALHQGMPPFTAELEPLKNKVTLTLTSTRSTYHVGETVHLRLTLHNSSDAKVLGAFTLESAMKKNIYFRHGTPDFRELEHLRVVRGFEAENIVTLDPDGRLAHDFVVALDPATQRPLLDEPGDYEFFARYTDIAGQNGLLESNIARVSVIDVPADQKAALAAYRQGLAFFAEFNPARPHTVTPAQIQAGADFLEKYRGSLYSKDVALGVGKAVAERVYSKVASDSEQALLKKIREELLDTIPPTLTVSAAPPNIWPPNHKLVPIMVTVNVTDNQDTNPTVKLDSITCDDGCDPAKDVSGAALNTDDRDFELRAERKGSGSGRTYTITYSAVDDAGNLAVSVTTVVVAHDQSGGSAPAWSGNGVAYKVGDQVSHQGNIWQCIQAHRSRTDWAPPRTPSFWVKVPQGIEWDFPVQYKLDEEVTFQGVTYRCRQAHTSQAGWTPLNTPALWSRVP